MSSKVTVRIFNKTDCAIPVPVSLAKFLKIGDGVELPITEVVKQIESYIREQNLRDKDDRRIIHPDTTLRNLFGLKVGETIDLENFEELISRHYPSNYINGQDFEDEMSTKQDLFDQIEELKKKAEELKKKAKDFEEKNKDTEFNKQKNFLINTVRDFLEIEVSDAEVLAILYRFVGSLINHPQGHTTIAYYLKMEDQNMLFERKVINRYAKYHEIRYEDSFEIIQNFVTKIKSKDQPQDPNVRRSRAPKAFSL